MIHATTCTITIRAAARALLFVAAAALPALVAAQDYGAMDPLQR